MTLQSPRSMDRKEGQNKESAAGTPSEVNDSPMEVDREDQAGRFPSDFPPRGNRGARECPCPSQITPDESTAMATADQPEVIKHRKGSTDQPGCSSNSEAEDNRKYLMECSKCNIKFAPSVEFDQHEANIKLHKMGEDDQTPFFTKKLSRPEQGKKKNLEATSNNCQHKLYYKFTTSNNKKGGFDINLSIEKVNDKEQQGMSRDRKQPGLRQEQTGTTTSGPGASGILKDGRSKDVQPARDEKSGNVGITAAKEKEEYKLIEYKRQPENSFANSTGSVPNTDELIPHLGKQIISGITETGRSFLNVFKSGQSNQTMKAKVHFISDHDTFGAADAIKTQLQNNMGSSLQEERRREECNMIVVFCPVDRRVESDVNSMMVETAVSSSGKPVILVLMHHTRKPDYSTAPYDPRESWKSVVHCVHVLFHETTPGLLKCRENYQAIKDIQQFLQKKQQFV